MNLNSESIGTVSEETEQFYAMADKKLVQKYVMGERILTSEQKSRYSSHYNTMALISGLAISTGLISYCYLLMPMGKVLRDIKDAQMSPQRRFMRRMIPFMGLTIPIMIARDVIDNSQKRYMDK